MVDDSELESDNHGRNYGGNFFNVKKSEANTTSGPHEVGHSLIGKKHSSKGLMTEGINDPNHSGIVTRYNILDIIQNALKGSFLAALETKGNAPEGFDKGKIKTDNKKENDEDN